MVATDIAARGIDVLSISHVINYDMPDTTDAYTHRIGRTGRAERTGEAYTLVTADDVNDVRDVERVLGYRLERRTVPGFDYRAPAPARDHEFARDPRPQPVARRSQTAFSSHPAPAGQEGAGRVLSQPARRTPLSGPASVRKPWRRAPSGLKARPVRPPAELSRALPHLCGTEATRLPPRWAAARSGHPAATLGRSISP